MKYIFVLFTVGIFGWIVAADDVLLELGPDGDFVISADGKSQISFNRDGTIDAANLPLSTFVEVGDPTKENDASEGFIAGSLWYNETDQRLLVCTDASDDAAVWLAVVRELGISDIDGLDDALAEKAGLSVVYTRSDVDLFLSDKQDLIGDGDLTIENTAGLQNALDALWPRDGVDADDSLGDSDDLVPTQGAVKAYVDSRVLGVNWIESAVAGTTRDMSLSGLDPVDGELISAGDRVVVMNQDNASENGVYVVAGGAWSRVVEMDADDEYQGRVVFVSGGLTNRNSSWWSSFENGEIEFFQISKVSGFSEGAGISIVNGEVSVSSSVLATIEGNRQKVGLTTRQAGLIELIDDKANLADTYTDDEVDALLTLKQDFVMDGDLRIAQTGGLQDALDARILRSAISRDPLLGDSQSTVSSQAAIKAYVDSRAVGLSWSGSVRVATTGSITLADVPSVDGVATVVGDRVLVRAQDDATENGIYVVADGSWGRAADMDEVAEYGSRAVFVTDGASNGGSSWVSQYDNGAIEFTQFSRTTEYTAGAGLLLQGGQFSVLDEVLNEVATIQDKADAAAVYLKQEVDDAVATKQDSIGDADLRIAQTDGLQAALDAKALAADVYEKTEVDGIAATKQDVIADEDLRIAQTEGLQAALNEKAVAADVYVKTDVDDLVATKQDLIGDGDLTIAKTDGLQDALDAKAVAADTYTKTEVDAIAATKQDMIEDDDLRISQTNGLQDVLDGLWPADSVDADDNLGDSDVVVPTQAAVKAYVDSRVVGVSWVESAVAGTTRNLALTGLDATDGVALSEGDRVVVMNQDDGSENGIYEASADAWTRVEEMNAPDENEGLVVFIANGVTHRNSSWWSSYENGAISFFQISQVSGFSEGEGISILNGEVSVEQSLLSVIEANRLKVGLTAGQVALINEVSDKADSVSVYSRGESDALLADKQGVLGAGDLSFDHVDGLNEALGARILQSEISRDPLLGNSHATVSSQAAIKQYVDSRIVGLSWSASVRVATTGSVALNGTPVVDDVQVVAGDRVLVRTQDDATDNGIYVVADGAWVRADDQNEVSEYQNRAVFVAEGTTFSGSSWVSDYDQGVIQFSQFASTTSYTAGAGLVLQGSQFSVLPELLAEIDDISEKADAADVYTKTEVDAVAAAKHDVIDDGDLRIAQTDGLQDTLDAKALAAEVYLKTEVDGIAATKQDLIEDGDLRIAQTDGLEAALGEKAVAASTYTKTDVDDIAATKQDVIEDDDLRIAQTDGLQAALDAKAVAADTYTKTEVDDIAATKQDVIADGDLTIAKTDGLQAALDAKAVAADTYTKTEVDDIAATKQDVIADGDLTIAKTDGLQAALDAKAVAADTYTKTEVDDIAATKQDVIADGDLTIAKTDGLQAALGAKAVAADTYTKTEVDDIAATKQDVIADGDLTIAKTDGLQAALDAKAVAADTYTKTEVDDIAAAKQDVIADGDLTIAKTEGLQAALDAKAVAADTYTKTEADDIAATKQDVIADGDLTIAKTDGLQAALDAKAVAADTYTKTEADDIAATKQDVIADGDLTIAKTDGLQAALDAKAVAADTYTKTEVDDVAATKQDVIEDNDLRIVQTDGLQATLDAKAVAADTYTKTEADDIAATKQDVIEDDDLRIAQTDGLQAALDAKVALASIDTDSTMAANSDTRIPSQRAVREFVSQFDRNLANVLSVGEGGEFATIQAALDAITDNAADKRYLIYVGPGEYPEQLQMKSFVDVQGAGRNMTRIVGTGAGALETAAVIQMASNSVLRDLSVLCTSANAYAVGLHVDTVAAQASSVDVVVSGGTTGNVGILIDDSNCELENVSSSASGATGSDYGIWYRTAASAVTGVIRGGSYVGGTCAALLDAASATLKIYGAVLDGGAHADAGVLFVQGGFDANGCALPQVCGNTYVVIDVSAGPSADTYPVSYLSEVPLDLLDDLRYRTDLIVLRRLSAAQYVQGSPSSEAGRDDNETRRRVRLTKDYYMGVFEVTQGQYLYVMGGNPSTYTGVSRPVESVSWQTVRGPAEDWPAGSGLPDEHSFMGRLSEKAGLACDLPTEAEWEYACRGGSYASLGSGQSLTVLNGADAAIDAVGRYLYNHAGSQHAQVGSYQPNTFGLYDMHGNVYEWCLDRWDGFVDYDGNLVNPSGAGDGSNRVRRGGAWSSAGRYLRSANRDAAPTANQHHGTGFRMVIRP